MKFTSLLVPAMLAAGVTASFAQESENAKKHEGKRDRSEVVAKEQKKTPPKDVEKRQQKPREDGRGQNERQFRRPDDAGPQSMMLRMFEDPEFCEKLGLSSEVREQIGDEFKKIDKSVDAKREELADLQANQAKLIVDRASEDEVMAAVDKAWQARAEIAKMQTLKLLKLRSKLTEEQIKKIDQVRNEHFRTRRLDQIREGEGGQARGPRDGRQTPHPERDDKKVMPPSPEGGKPPAPPAEPEQD